MTVGMTGETMPAGIDVESIGNAIEPTMWIVPP
jgi:hypothetical protein